MSPAGGCAHTSTDHEVAASRPVVDSSLGPGDVFDVRVFGEADLSGGYRVDSDGSIDYPLVGRVAVGGKLPGDVAELLAARLRPFLRKPAVSVFVREVNSKHVIVYGQVAKPGTFPFGDIMTISQAISLAGGFSTMAARDHVRISRYAKERQRVVTVDLRAISDGKSPNQFLQPGDEVYVPERLF